MLRTIGCLVVVVVLVGLSGCGGGGGGPNTVPVRGIVTFQGKPVEGAHVTFVPQAPGTPAAFAQTDAQGRFQLMHATGQGAVPGPYGVTIAKYVTDGGTRREEAEAHFQETDQPPPEPKVTSLLPAKYKKVETSGLSATVESGGAEDFKFELTP